MEGGTRLDRGRVGKGGGRARRLEAMPIRLKFQGRSRGGGGKRGTGGPGREERDGTAGGRLFARGKSMKKKKKKKQRSGAHARGKKKRTNGKRPLKKKKD